ncbi:hypothetical protein ACF1BE_17660 [Streptomyces sp. NPDC014991]|uniref:hypothetical protein n=1 Tax=Streptomyces sp. NPDC014991 TaxID=3364935 RepID=UPI0037031DD8
MGSTSTLEIRNYAELSYVLKDCDFVPEHEVRIPHLPRRTGAVDMLFRDRDGSQPGIVVEFDGAWWHDNEKNRSDIRKTYALIDAGFGVIRIRESPLLPIIAADVSVSKNQDAHLTSAAVLARMLELDWIPRGRRDRIIQYCDLGTAQAVAEASIMIHRRGGYDLATSAAEIRSRQGSSSWNGVRLRKRAPLHEGTLGLERQRVVRDQPQRTAASQADAQGFASDRQSQLLRSTIPTAWLRPVGGAARHTRA